jgi:hypothetical protein
MLRCIHRPDMVANKAWLKGCWSDKLYFWELGVLIVGRWCLEWTESLGLVSFMY